MTEPSAADKGPYGRLQLVLRDRVASVLLLLAGLGALAVGQLLGQLAVTSEPAGLAPLLRQQPWLALALLLPIATALAAFRLGEARHAPKLAPLGISQALAPREGGAASQATTRFLNTLSHEIRTPLLGLQSSAELLLAGSLAAPERDYALAISRAAESLLAALQEIVDSAQLAADELLLADADFFLHLTIEDALEQVAPEAAAKRLELGYLIAPELPTVLRGDTLRLRQLLVQLLRHSLAHTERGELRLRADLLDSTATAPMLLFSLDDTGHGIDATAKKAADTRQDRTELGLAVARRVLERMGGTLQIVAAPGEGASYRAKLPLRAGTTQSLPELDLGGAHVVIAFGGATTRLQLAQQMRHWNCRISTASDGPSLLATLRGASAATGAVDLVLADAALPGLDALQLPQLVARDAEMGLPRVLLAASPSAGDRWARLAQLQDCARVALPIRRERLLQALRHSFSLLPPSAAALISSTAQAVEAIVAAEKASHRGIILLVDDNAVNRRVANLMLSKAGYQVEEARDGQEATEKALAGNYDLILMDVQMPRRNGLEATQAIRAAEGAARHTPILAMTARAMGNDVQECLEAGMDGYVSKPVRGPALLAAVEGWVAAPLVSVADSAQSSDSPVSGAIAPILAPGALAELRACSGDDGDAIVIELANMFLRGAREHVGKMRQALRSGDLLLFERAAHTLKGSSGTLGARQLEEVCRKLEDEARNGRLPPSNSTLDELDAMLRCVREVIERDFAVSLEPASVPTGA